MAYIGKSPSSGIRNRFIYTATAGQTTFSGSDDENRTLSYTDGHFTDVYLNGVKLDKSDYTATSGTSVVLDEGAAVDDILEVVAFDTFSVFNGEFSQDVTVGGTLTASGNVDVTGNELILDADGDTSITADTDDQIDFKTGGTDRMTLTSDGKLGIAETSPDQLLHVGGIAKVGAGDGSSDARIIFESDSTEGDGWIGIPSWDTDSLFIYGPNSSGGNEIVLKYDGNSELLLFHTGGTERMRIDSSGYMGVGYSGADVRGAFRDTSRPVARFDRQGTDGSVINIMGQGNTEGQISVNGSTVTYGGFTGSHWSRLSDNSQPTILKGTVLESIGDMVDWYNAEFTTGSGDDAVDHKIGIVKPSGKNEGDTFDYVVSADDATDYLPAGTYTATLVKEDDVKHVQVKVGDTSESKAVYGVFLDWDAENGVNDMIVASVGSALVRIKSTETIAIGDLLDSNGDGTAKVQSDDIARSRTIGKVLSTVKQETYSDGSYTVPCALYCG